MAGAGVGRSLHARRSHVVIVLYDCGSLGSYSYLRDRGPRFSAAESNLYPSTFSYSFTFSSLQANGLNVTFLSVLYESYPRFPSELVS